jgi:pimeloyl-ACP methyl ester carboxylesterase
VPALTVPAGDTLLHVLDTPGGEPSLLLLNGAFGTLQDWNKVTARLDGSYRTVRFDARGRGKSGTSADYSFNAAVEDVGRVIEATGVTRPVLVGWSHGATTAVRYAAKHPGQVAGLVLIDGGFPIAMFDENAKQAARAVPAPGVLDADRGSGRPGSAAIT